MSDQTDPEAPNCQRDGLASDQPTLTEDLYRREDFTNVQVKPPSIWQPGLDRLIMAGITAVVLIVVATCQEVLR